MTRKNDTEFDKDQVKHVVGIDRGLRYLMTTYDKKDQTSFYSGEAVCRKRDTFNKVRAELQSKGTKSHKACIETYFGTREPLDERCQSLPVKDTRGYIRKQYTVCDGRPDGCQL